MEKTEVKNVMIEEFAKELDKILKMEKTEVKNNAN
jgi:hypothetical protein